MSDNVGLPTPRGSGTSGYIQRNLAHMKPRDMAAPYPPRDNDRQHRPRQPDKGLLEHERKREVEVKVFELRDRLEEEGVEEDEIETRCDELRKKLLAEMERGGDRGVGPTRKTFKMHQVHELADAKIKESERLRQALKISRDYEEGSHWRRQEEKLKKSLEQQEAERKTPESTMRLLLPALTSLALLAPAMAAPAGDATKSPSLWERALSWLVPREDLCHLPSPPQLCVPNASVTVEETALRAYQFYRAFVVDGDPRTMFSLIDDVYIQHNPFYQDGPQAIWRLFCGGRRIGSEESTSWCFDASTNMSYANYGNIDRWKWVDGCVHEHWDQGERMPSPDKCYQLPAN
ncbi:hypothetical protein VTJ49DRAFT_5238 [Mycothermus thermophilus]|uniref:CWF21 domain-containing protein n=1 Tax=Humicola insolens TaxID=85995 RepID=A0ABR3V3L9_HUMIN